MSLPAQSLSMTADEYLRTEELSSMRREFLDGQVYAMVGASDAHNVISLNLATILRLHLRGSGCRAYIADMKIRIKATNCFYYPDLMVTCEPFKARSNYKTSPVLVCEVLSPSTVEIDRREKLAAYKQVHSVREYLVVHQDQKKVELYRKTATDKWELLILQENDQLALTSLPNGHLTLTVSALYEDVEF